MSSASDQSTSKDKASEVISKWRGLLALTSLTTKDCSWD